MSKKQKDHLNLVVIGHIDHGKSTMMGALLIESGAITDREARELEKLAKEYIEFAMSDLRRYQMMFVTPAPPAEEEGPYELVCNPVSLFLLQEIVTVL